jgi:hypothetical protein
MFLGARAADPSPTLRVRLATVTSRPSESHLRDAAATVTAWAAVAAVAALALNAVLGQSGIRDIAVPAQPGAPTGPAFPVEGAGIGVVVGVPWGHLALLGVAIGGSLVAFVLVRRTVVRLALVGGLAVVALVVAAIVTMDPLGPTSVIWAPGEGFHDEVIDGSGANEPTAWFGVEADEPFTFGFGVRNDGSVPITVVGLADQEDPILNYRVVGLGLPLQPLDVHFEDAVAFEPVVIEPGGVQFIVVAGRGGSCATPAIGQPDQRAGVGFSSLELVYSTFGWERTRRVGLGRTVMVGTAMDCRAGPMP